MKKLNLLKTMFLLCALMVGSSVWAEEETIASFTASTYYGGTTGGWSVDNSDYATAGGGYYKLISPDASITTPSINWTNYTSITITISARKFGGPDATQGKISVRQGEKEMTSYSPSSTSIVASSALSISPVDGSITISCPGASSSKGCGVQSIVIKGTENVDPSAPAASLSTTSLDFGTVNIGTTKSLTFTVTPANLTSALSISCDNDKYEVTPTSIAQDVTTATTITVTSKPTAVTDDMDGTITISGGGLEANKTVTLTTTAYDPNAPGTENNPYTVAEAIAYIGTLGTATSPNDVYVQGIISKVDSYSSGAITYWISDDGTTDNQMEVYKGKGINGADFSSEDDLLVGGAVVVKGKVKMYNSIPEFISNNQLVSYDEPQITKHTLTVVASNGSVEIEGKTLDEEGKCEIAEGKSVTATATPAEHYSFASWTAEGITLEDATANPLTFAMPENDVTLTANFTENPSHIVTFSILGATTDGAVVFEDEAINFPVVTAPTGYAFVGWTTTEIDGTQTAAPEDLVTSAVMGNADIIYYAVFAKSSGGGSSDTYALVSDVDDLNDGDKIILVSTGSYKTGGVTYNFTVANGNVNENKLIDPVDVTISDNTVTSTGVTPITLVEVTGGWKLQIGTQYLNIVATKNNIVLDDEGAVNTISIASNVATIGGIADGSDTRYIYYNPNSGNGRFAYYKSKQKDVSIYKQEGGTTYSDYCTSIIVSATVTSAGWATYITPAAVEFGEDEAYVVTDASIAQGLALEAITEAPANTPVLLKGEGPKTFNVVASADAPAKNKLTVCDGTIADGFQAYVLAKKGEGAAFKRWTGEIETLNGRVILPLDQAVASAREFFDLDGETTGIDAMHNAQCTMHNEVFDLQGRRVAQPTKGLYIVNGKKMVIK